MTRGWLSRISILLLTFLLGTTVARADQQHNHLNEIARSLLEVQKELLLVNHKLMTPISGQVFTLYLDVEHIPQLALESVIVRLDGTPLIEIDYDQWQNTAFAKGGIQKIHQGPLSPGEHEIKVDFFAQLSGPVVDSKIYRFNKTTEDETLTVTIIDVLRAHEPELTFYFERSIKQ